MGRGGGGIRMLKHAAVCTCDFIHSSVPYSGDSAAGLKGQQCGADWGTGVGVGGKTAERPGEKPTRGLSWVAICIGRRGRGGRQGRGVPGGCLTTQASVGCTMRKTYRCLLTVYPIASNMLGHPLSITAGFKSIFQHNTAKPYKHSLTHRLFGAPLSKVDEVLQLGG